MILIIVSEDLEESQESLIKLRTEMESQIEQREKEIEKGNNNTTMYISNYKLLHLIDQYCCL